jgi:hypothetical protein
VAVAVAVAVAVTVTVTVTVTVMSTLAVMWHCLKKRSEHYLEI